MTLSITPKEEGGKPQFMKLSNTLKTNATLFSFPNKEMLLHNANESIPERQKKKPAKTGFFNCY